MKNGERIRASGPTGADSEVSELRFAAEKMGKSLVRTSKDTTAE